MKKLSRTFAATLLMAATTAQLVAQAALDRTKRPASGPPVALRFPKVERHTLSNGIAVALLENHELPIVSVQAIVEARGTLDPSERDGLVIVLGQMLPEGTTSMTADQLAEAFADLGNTVSPNFFTTITANADRSLALMADMLMHPAFPQASLDRIRANEIAGIKRLKDQPGYIAQRVFSNAVYGTGHPYERVRTDASLTALTRDDLITFHSTYYRPQNVTIVLAGDLKPKDALAKLEKAFGGWPRGGKKTAYDIPAPKTAAATTIYLYDRPNSPQSVIMVGQLGPRRDSPDYYATELMNAGLGGIFNSRLNLNLREKHAYTYGANSGFQYRPAPEVGAFIASTQVVTPKTDSALIELVKELKEIRDVRPMTPAELELARANQTLSLPMRFEALNSMAAAVAGILRDKLPADYYDQFSSHMAKVRESDVTDAARKYLDPAHMAIVVVGDRKQIEAALRAANIAPVVIVDEHAKPVVVP
jgi:zinc protease